MNGVKQRSRTLVELADNLVFYAKDGAPAIADDKARALLTPEAQALLGKLAKALEGENDWSEKQTRGRHPALRRGRGRQARPGRPTAARGAERLDRVARHLRGAVGAGTGGDQAEIAGGERIDVRRRSTPCRRMTLARLDLVALACSAVGRLVLLRQGGGRRVAAAHRRVRACRLGRHCSQPRARDHGQGLFRAGTPWPTFLSMGLLNNLMPFSLIFWAQTHITSGVASILNATTPLFTVLVAHVATDDERMTRTKTFAVLIGFAGVAVLSGPVSMRSAGRTRGASSPASARPSPMPWRVSMAAASRHWVSRR